MTIRATAFRLVVALAVTLSLAATVLVTASFFIAANQPQGYLGLHLAVSGMFMLVGLLFGGTGVQVVALANMAAMSEAPVANGLGSRVFRLLVFLVIAGLGLCILLAAATLAILDRIGQGFAVFG